MRLLITMNMPSAAGNNVHQLTVEHKAANLAEFCEYLNNDIFIWCRIYYRRINHDGTVFWQDKGDIVLNTAHIGKAQEYIEYDRSEVSEESSEHAGGSVSSYRGPRGTIRPPR